MNTSTGMLTKEANALKFTDHNRDSKNKLPSTTQAAGNEELLHRLCLVSMPAISVWYLQADFLLK